jgi:hypothetical protein
MRSCSEKPELREVGRFEKRVPQRLKAAADSRSLTARLKPRPFKAGVSARIKCVP